MNIQLTISLLASNRTGSLERCLESLGELRSRIPSELIVVFTGTDKKVRSIAEKYTDHIVDFTWCDDFSAARNAGLKEAMGEWFLFIDDDEWFESTEQICTFFQSGEYKKYASACYTVRNYKDWSGTGYQNSWAHRLSRIVPDLHFENPIHEELTPMMLPCKFFQEYVHHYGYAESEVKKEDGKTSRNLPLLLRDIQERPRYLKNYMQIVKEYFVREEWAAAEAYCMQGKKIAEEEKEKEVCRWFQIKMAQILYSQKDKERAAAGIERILRDEKPCEIVRLELYNLLLCIYTELERYEEAVKAGSDFEELLTKMDRNPQLWKKQGSSEFSEETIKDENRLYPGRVNSAQAAFQVGNKEKAEYFLRLLPWEEEYQIENYYPEFDKWKNGQEKLFREVMLKMEIDSSYLLLQKILEADRVNSPEFEKLFQKGTEKIRNVYLQAQMIETALLRGASLSEIAAVTTLDVWKACIAKAVGKIPLGNIKKIVPNEVLKEGYSIQKLWMEKVIKEKLLRQEQLVKKEFEEALEDYCKAILTFYKLCYQDIFFEGANQYLLPADCRFAIIVTDAMEKSGKGEYAAAVHLLREAVQICPENTGIVWEMVQIVKRKAKIPEASSQEEFRRLAFQMKTAVQGMIDQRQYAEAEQIISQLLPLLPEDPGLLKLRERIFVERAEQCSGKGRKGN